MEQVVHSLRDAESAVVDLEPCEKPQRFRGPNLCATGL